MIPPTITSPTHPLLSPRVRKPMKVKSQNSFVLAVSLDISALFERGLALQRAKRKRDSALISFSFHFSFSPHRQCSGSFDPFEFHMLCTVLARILLS